MIIGTILGIPISIWAIYFLIVRPVLNLMERADPDTKVGKASHTILVVLGISFFVMLAVVGIAVAFVLAAA